MEYSKIEWTDHTCNFWYGCVEVSPACDFCYAKTMMDTRYGKVEWGGDRRRAGAESWRKPFCWQREAEQDGKRRRVFTLSLGDFFDNQVDPQWHVDAWDVIRRCPNLDWLILTKRPQNILKTLPADWGKGWDNCWLGCTVENQTEAKRRIPHLLKVPAAVLFLSCEPLLEKVDLSEWVDLIDWVIVGGETGTKPRYLEPDWARDLRKQCSAPGTAYFVKQMTAKKTIPSDLLIREFPTSIIDNNFDRTGEAKTKPRKEIDYCIQQRLQ